jgi:hypothetical protein
VPRHSQPASSKTDLTKQFGTKTRLLATAADGALAFLLGFFV